MSRNIVYKLDITDDSIEKITNVTPVLENNYTDIAWWYCNWGTNTAKIKFFPEKFFGLTGVNPLPSIKMIRETDTEIIDAIVPSSEQETGWSLYYFHIVSGISGIVKSNRATQYRVSFQEYEIDLTDELYLGEHATAETVEATINAELKVKWPSAISTNYVNVFETSDDDYKTWEFDGTDWNKETTVYNEALLTNTLEYTETFKATTLSNDDFNTQDATALALTLNTIYAEIDYNASLISALTGGAVDFMEIADYDTDGTATLNVKFARNMHTSTGVNDSTAAEVKTTRTDAAASKVITDKITVSVGLDVTGDIQLNQDLETTDSPTFVNETLTGDLGVVNVAASGEITTPNIDFNVGDAASGDLSWNDTDKTLDLTVNGVTLQIGQEALNRMRNNTGSTITNGTPVYISGGIGASGRATIAEIDISDHTQSHKAFGVTTEDIANGADGFVTTRGFIRGLNTSAFASGDILWVSASGGLTATRPTSPNNQIQVGTVVVSSSTVGTIFAHIKFSEIMAHLSDVYAPSPADKNGIRWNNSASRYENVAVLTEAEIQALIAAVIDSSPAALDTLNELAAALGDDANFSTTMTNSLALKETIANVDTLKGAGWTTETVKGNADDITAIESGRVEKDLSNDTTYPVATAAGLADDLLTDVYIDDNGTPKKISLNEVYAGANTATGSFVDSADYQANGLGAHEAAVLDYHTLLLDTAGKYYCTIKSFEDKKIYYFLFPTITSNTNDLEISVTGNTAGGISVYKEVFVNGDNVYAELFSDLIVKFTYDGTNLHAIMDTALPQPITFTEMVNSHYGVLAGINGIPEISDIYGLSLYQQNDNGDFASGIGVFSGLYATVPISSGIVSVTGDGTNTRAYIRRTDKLAIIGNTYVYKAKFRVTNSDCLDIILSRSASGSFITTPTINVWYEKSVVVTATQTEFLRLGHEYVDNATQNGKVMEVEYIMITDITNTPLASKTATQMNAIVPTYFEGSKHITNPEYKTVGLNGFNKVTIDVGYWPSNSTGELVANDAFNATAFIPIAGGITDIYIDGTDNTIHSGVSQFCNFYDANQNFISSQIFVSTGATISVVARTVYIKFTVVDEDLDTAIIVYGTSVPDYEAYNSPATNFKLLNKDGTDLPMLSVSETIRDKAYYLNAEWWKDKYVIERTLIADDIESVANGTNIQRVELVEFSNQITFLNSGIVEGYSFVEGYPEKGYADDTANENTHYSRSTTNKINIVVPLGTYADLAAAKTDLTGTIVQYAVDEITTTEIEANGSVIQGKNTTVISQNDFATEISMVFNLDNKAQQGVLIKNNIDMREEIRENEIDIATNKTAVALNTTHRGTDGISDHSQVSTNKTNADASKVITDYITATANVNLNKVVEWPVLMSGAINIGTGSTSNNVTLSASMDGYDFLAVDWGKDDNSKSRVDIVPVKAAMSIVLEIGSSSTVKYMFKLVRSSTTLMDAEYGYSVTTTYGASAGLIRADESGLDIFKIYGLKL